MENPWIPAFAGMTKDDSGVRRNDERFRVPLRGPGMTKAPGVQPSGRHAVQGATVSFFASGNDVSRIWIIALASADDTGGNGAR